MVADPVSALYISSRRRRRMARDCNERKPADSAHPITRRGEGDMVSAKARNEHWLTMRSFVAPTSSAITGYEGERLMFHAKALSVGLLILAAMLCAGAF